MTNSLDKIVSNARNGRGACSGCPAHADTQGKFVNPGLLNYDGDLMFLTMDPSHYIDWEKFGSWTEYNEEKGRLFKSKWRGGVALRKLLDGVPGYSIDDIWLADAVKCPVENDRAGEVSTAEAFAHCSMYLRREINEVAPRAIVTMGNNPAVQLLNGIYDQGVGPIKAGTRDCGTIYDTAPPVVVSPHWANGWLGRNNNRRKVQKAIREVLSI